MTAQYPKTMEQIKQATQKVTEATQEAQSGLQGATEGIQNVISTAQCMITKAAECGQCYMKKYPTLAAYGFSLLVFSAIPVSLFVLFASISSAVTLGLSLFGFAVVQGILVLFGGGVLLLVLGAIASVTTMVFFWVSLFYGGVQGLSSFFSRMKEMGVIEPGTSTQGSHQGGVCSPCGMPATMGGSTSQQPQPTQQSQASQQPQTSTVLPTR